MSLTAASKFRSIRDFPELVDYLGDELDWPIETDDFEEMTFEYSAAELGLDEKTAPKFLEIRRLRPLDKDQPWGIFFIRFDDNKLPVVALRRLLSKLVLKKRSTSNSGDRASWHESDLLLISQTGNLGTQSISFAHFAANPEKTDLPILKVLGWDDDDTGLKIDYVIETLREKLIWPDDPTDSDAWRAQWRDAFTLKNREVIQNSKEMAERLGQLALAVRTRLREVLAIESDEGPIHKLMSVFKENLISDLDTDSFSDMYAQTIAYGLLSARIINPKADTADAAHTQIPITNPFLRDLMETFLNVGGRDHTGGVGLDFDELGINEVVDLLDNTNMEAVLRDFGDRNQKEDPVMHFFEGFLQEYDSQIRKDRGVFYTPQPVVSFIVRSVDEQLRTEFGLADGLADTTTWGELAERTADIEIPEGTSSDQAFVQILDPATGTGTFPVEVIDLIYTTMAAKWQSQGHREVHIKELWNEYVPKHLLPRLHGYELMMAPYAIAHMKVGLKLYETGYLFASDERAHIYLTNALEPAQDTSGTFDFAIPALAHEVRAVNRIKDYTRFTVIIGNPPYSVKSYNQGEWIRNLISDFKKNLNETKINLDDDFIKFFGIAFHKIAQSGIGVLGFVTNNVFLTGVTHRQIRAHIFNQFSLASFINLRGDSRIGENIPIGEVDENVFDIQQGVSISILVAKNHSKNLVEYLDLWGTREEKAKYLIGDKIFDKVSIEPKPPLQLIKPPEEFDISEYDYWPKLTDWMPIYSNGIETHKDALTICFSEKELKAKTNILLSMKPEDARSKLDIGEDGRDWKLANAVKSLKKTLSNSAKVDHITYRPFDKRFTVLNKKSGGFIAYPRWEVMSNFVNIDNNIGLITARLHARKGGWDSCFVSRFPSEKKTGDSTRSSAIFPAFIAKNEFFGDTENSANFSHSLKKLTEENLKCEVEYIEIFQYIYCVLSSPSYRNRYFESLKTDFPRIPLCNNLSLFNKLSRLGSNLIKMHLLEFSPGSKISKKIGEGNFQIEKIFYCSETIWINHDRTQGFGGVKNDIWNFHVGGYQVCEKWLKDRGPKKGNPGLVLTHDDLVHYQKVIFSIEETIRIAAEIDEVIDTHGGWPNAFITANS